VPALKTLAWFLRSVLCLVEKYLSVFITAESLLLFPWTSQHKEITQNLRTTGYSQCSACPPFGTTHLLERTPRISRQPAKLGFCDLFTFLGTPSPPPMVACTRVSWPHTICQFSDLSGLAEHSNGY
ncbi:hypothetical protein XENOCAPTIV_009786, partial [Xenoophorus captivus]